jgi:UDPglucose--hexose-1-phosphate uridylyltransferase
VASRLPYEVWILPKRHNSHFELTAQEDLADLAKLLRSVLVKLEHLQPSVACNKPLIAYNWWLHTAPFHDIELNERRAFDTDSFNHYHWHIEVVPRIATTAGFEWCSGWHINSIPADQAAAKLRNIENRA